MAAAQAWSHLGELRGGSVHGLGAAAGSPHHGGRACYLPGWQAAAGAGAKGVPGLDPRGAAAGGARGCLSQGLLGLGRGWVLGPASERHAAGGWPGRWLGPERGRSERRLPERHSKVVAAAPAAAAAAAAGAAAAAAAGFGCQTCAAEPRQSDPPCFAPGPRLGALGADSSSFVLPPPVHLCWAGAAPAAAAAAAAVAGPALGRCLLVAAPAVHVQPPAPLAAQAVPCELPAP